MPFMDVPGRTRPTPLTGPIKRRADARVIYDQIVCEMEACEDRDTLEIYLMTVGEELIQFERELEFFWNGDGGDFLGLNREIAKSYARFATYY